MTLVIITLRNHVYEHENVTNVRESKLELRWTNALGEKRSMACAFIEDYCIK